MTPKEVRKFFSAVIMLEETQGKLNNLYFGDEDFWFECRDEKDLPVKHWYWFLPGDNYTITFLYYYPSDLYVTLFVAHQWREALAYLRGDYLRLVRDIQSEMDGSEQED